MRANILQPTLQKAQVETASDGGRPGDAVHDAFQEIERLVRDLAGGVDASPVELMQPAFAPATGPLADPTAGVGAHRATRRMFVESFVKYRPDAEHAAALDDPLEAVEGLLPADLPARELARVAVRLGGALGDVP